MAYCMIAENPKISEEQGLQVMEYVRESGPVPPEGARLVIAGPADPGWRVITIWDTDEARERFFAERLGPAYERAGVSLADMKRTVFEVQALVAGDLTGTAQPA